ncbi:MAG: LON peptidase substrate-binding domain-containing protein [Gammaproteobacteria bacterium]
MSALPLFPLKTVLFPGGPLALRIFEPRYVDLVARCMRGPNRFGVVSIREGEEVGVASLHEVGTTAEIVDWHEEDGGMLGILATGRQMFRLGSASRQPDGLYVGEIELLPREPPLALPPEHEPLAALLKRVLKGVSLYRGVEPSFDNAVWVAARLVEVLPLERAFKQSLLEAPNALTRLERLAADLAKGQGLV